MRKKAYEVPYLERKAVTKAKQLPHLTRSDPKVKSGIKYKVDNYETPEDKATAARLKRRSLENKMRWPWYAPSPKKNNLGKKRAMEKPTYKSVRYEK